MQSGLFFKKINITGMMVYSEQFGLIGKIDQYFMEGQRLIERKRTIKTIYDGYKLKIKFEFEKYFTGADSVIIFRFTEREVLRFGHAIHRTQDLLVL